LKEVQRNESDKMFRKQDFVRKGEPNMFSLKEKKETKGTHENDPKSREQKSIILISKVLR
jgi:hypothetical protein